VAAVVLVCPLLEAAVRIDYKSRLGTYVWGSLAGGLPAAIEDSRRLGFDRAIRVYIGPGRLWDAIDASDNRPLDLKVQRPDYLHLLDTFPVVMFTAYDAAADGEYKAGQLGAAALEQVKDEFRRFTLEISKKPGTRIVSNWEFEHECGYEQWEGCLAYMQARVDGISRGREEARLLRYPGVVYSAFEGVVLPDFLGRQCGFLAAAARLKGLDLLSYSSWRSVVWDGGGTEVRDSFREALRRLRELASQMESQPKLIIGELGQYWDSDPGSQRLKAAIDTALDNGAEYVFCWNLYEQPGRFDEWGRDASHFGMFYLDRTLTPQGEAFSEWLAPPKLRSADTPDEIRARQSGR
jgi:hypothetical protein